MVAKFAAVVDTKGVMDIGKNLPPESLILVAHLDL
jgi:hypothetical protein